MAHRRLQLSLSAGEPLSTSLNWRIEVGYVVLTSWNDEEHPATLGIWGPGELVIPSLLGGQSLQLLSLSAVQVQEWTPSAEERQQVLSQQLLQLVKLLELSRIRRAEVRLYSLLLWLGERFGRVGSQGVSLSFNAMNLTRRNLAEITGTDTGDCDQGPDPLPSGRPPVQTGWARAAARVRQRRSKRTSPVIICVHEPRGTHLSSQLVMEQQVAIARALAI